MQQQNKISREQTSQPLKKNDPVMREIFDSYMTHQKSINKMASKRFHGMNLAYRNSNEPSPYAEVKDLLQHMWLNVISNKIDWRLYESKPLIYFEYVLRNTVRDVRKKGIKRSNNSSFDRTEFEAPNQNPSTGNVFPFEKSTANPSLNDIESNSKFEEIEDSEHTILIHQIEQSLSDIDPSFGDVFILKLNGLTHKDIIQCTGLTEHKVKKAITTIKSFVTVVKDQIQKSSD